MAVLLDAVQTGLYFGDKMVAIKGDRTRDALVQAGASDLLPSVGDGRSLPHRLLHSRYERAVGKFPRGRLFGWIHGKKC